MQPSMAPFLFLQLEAWLPLDLPFISSFYPSLCAQKYAQNQLQRLCHQWINDQ